MILKKWWVTIVTSWTRLITYRANLVLQLFGPALIFFFIKYQLYDSIYKGIHDGSIAGYNFHQMMEYQLLTLVVALLAQGHNSMNLSEDIRLGRISAYLVYPFDFLSFHTASFLAFEFLQLIIVGLTISFAEFTGFVDLSPFAIARGLMFCIFTSTLWFAIQYLIGLLAFWLEETWVFRVILMNLSRILSGALIPLEFYPSWAVKLLYYTPFPYLTYVPVKMFSSSPPDFLQASLIIFGWTAFVMFLSRLVWNRGLRLYTAAGM